MVRELVHRDMALNILKIFDINGGIIDVSSDNGIGIGSYSVGILVKLPSMEVRLKEVKLEVKLEIAA